MLFKNRRRGRSHIDRSVSPEKLTLEQLEARRALGHYDAVHGAVSDQRHRGHHIRSQHAHDCARPAIRPPSMLKTASAARWPTTTS